MRKNRINVNWSYWELDQYFNNVDLIVIGGGIVGLFSAYFFKKKNKKAKVIVLERGTSPYGASTKNAGFACFGSLSELKDDLSKHGLESVFETVKMRYHGLQLLRKEIGDKSMDLRSYGGYEVFTSKEKYQENADLISEMNLNMLRFLGLKDVYATFHSKIREFGFKSVIGITKNKYEGQIDTGKMMRSLHERIIKEGVQILNGINVLSVLDKANGVQIETDKGMFNASKSIIATNGFAASLISKLDVKPARAQVLVTKPIPGLKIKGSFHYDEGFYYFRNINQRILFGGGRNLDLKGETTDKFEVTPLIQAKLESLMKNMILPSTPFEIEHRWVGIMGVGSEKRPIIKPVSTNVLAAVRMGGMGVAIGSLVGKEAANQIT